MWRQLGVSFGVLKLVYLFLTFLCALVAAEAWLLLLRMRLLRYKFVLSSYTDYFFFKNVPLLGQLNKIFKLYSLPSPVLVGHKDRECYLGDEDRLGSG